MKRPILMFASPENAPELGELAKSHVDQYVKKDGTVVGAHDNNRQKKAALSHDEWADKVKDTHGSVDFKKDAKKGVVHAWSGTDHVGSYQFAQGGKPASHHVAEKKAAGSDGYVAPKEGEVGHHEHTTYGRYFRRGDKVKDNSGKQHEVLEHVGPQVKTAGGESFHPTKLHHVSSAGEKSSGGSLDHKNLVDAATYSGGQHEEHSATSTDTHASRSIRVGKDAEKAHDHAEDTLTAAGFKKTGQDKLTGAHKFESDGHTAEIFHNNGTMHVSVKKKP